MPLLQIGSRSPKFIAKLAGQVAALAEQSSASAVVIAGDAQAAATEAGETATQAQTMAAEAGETATQAQATADDASEKTGRIFTLQQVRDSYSDDGVVSAAEVSGTARITIAAHNRHYLDGTVAVSVLGGVIDGVPLGTTRFVAYDDPTFSGGAVTYSAYATIDEATSSIASPAKHLVSAITTPAAGEPPRTGGSNLPWWKRPQEDPGVIDA